MVARNDMGAEVGRADIRTRMCWVAVLVVTGGFLVAGTPFGVAQDAPPDRSDPALRCLESVDEAECKELAENCRKECGWKKKGDDAVSAKIEKCAIQCGTRKLLMARASYIRKVVRPGEVDAQPMVPSVRLPQVSLPRAYLPTMPRSKEEQIKAGNRSASEKFDKFFLSQELRDALK
jgi:hypothetical protein